MLKSMTQPVTTAAQGPNACVGPRSLGQPVTVGAAVELLVAHQRRIGRQPETVRHTSLVLRPFVAWAGPGTLRWTGLRVSEAAAILDEDVDLSQREIRVRVSKTARGIRTIPILPVLEEPVGAWRAYCQRHGLHHPGATFLVTRHGTPMQSRHI